MLKEPKLEFYRDEKDPDDLGGWSCVYGDYRIYLCSEHANAERPYIYITAIDGPDDASITIHLDGNIELGASGCQTSFQDLLASLRIREAVRLLNNVK